MPDINVQRRQLLWLIIHQLHFRQMPNEEGFIEEGKKRAKKCIDVPLHGLWGEDVLSPLKPEVTCRPGPLPPSACFQGTACFQHMTFLASL